MAAVERARAAFRKRCPQASLILVDTTIPLLALEAALKQFALDGTTVDLSACDQLSEAGLLGALPLFSGAEKLFLHPKALLGRVWTRDPTRTTGAGNCSFVSGVCCS